MHNGFTSIHKLLMQQFVALALLFVGCNDPAPKVQGPPPQSAYIYDRDYFDDRQRARAETFKKFDDFAASIQHAQLTKVYEGLPHDVMEREAFESERKKKETTKVEGSYYYLSPISASPALTEQLRKLLTSRTSFVPFQGYKACGGFHPDWCLVWSEGSDTWAVLLCFGCGEMIVRKNGEREIYCDIWDRSVLESLLNPLHVNRPK